MTLHLARLILAALLLSAALAGSTLAAEPELAAVTASLRKQCIGYGYKAGTDALAECVMKLDLLQRAGQGSSPQVAAPVQNQPPAPTPARPVNKIVEPTDTTKPVAATSTPAGSPTTVTTTIETTIPAPPAEQTPAATMSETQGPIKKAEVTSSASVAKTDPIDRNILAKIKSISLLPIRDPKIAVESKANRTRQSVCVGGLGFCGLLGAVVADEISGSTFSAAEDLRKAKWALRPPLAEKHSSDGYGGSVADILTNILRTNSYETERIPERQVVGSNPNDFYKGQKSKSDAILHVRVVNSYYIDADDNHFRPYVDATVVLANSKYGKTLYRENYSCPTTTRSQTFAFSSAKLIAENPSKASEGIKICMEEIVRDVAATLKRPTPPPAQ